MRKDGDGAQVVFISNRARQVSLWAQSAALPDEPVVWDYHVIMITGMGPQALAWDLDSRLGCPADLVDYLEGTWLEHTQPSVPQLFAPRYRIVEAAAFRAAFASDRRHMLDAQGRFVQSPPPWPPIGQGHSLPQFVDMERTFLGKVVDLAGLKRVFAV